MTKVKFNYTEDNSKPHVICDTNVWYNIVWKKFTRPEEVLLIPTSFSLMELASTEVMVHEPKLYQEVLMTIYENSGPIIPSNPFDFVLQNHDPNYPVDETATKTVLTQFTEILKREIPDDVVIDEETKLKVISECQKRRGVTKEFADFSTEKLEKIRSNINKGEGKKAHLEVDTTELNKEMLKAFLNEHVKDKDYEIDFDSFDWSQVDLFLKVTENFFKKLETTKGMKVHPNDAVDWFNMLYVTSKDKYLTFEDKWRDFIVKDDRIKKYLYC